MFKTIADFFYTLNKSNVNYLILRNFGDFLSEDFLKESHPDIDVLCDDNDHFIKTSCCTGWKGEKWDKVHGKVVIGGKDISIDIRTIGDGYYCEKWQRDMLTTKTKEYDLFYRPNDEHLFYSLIYHGIIQKPILSDDYKVLLSLLATKYNVDIRSFDDNELVNILETYMIKNDYVYTYAEDKHVPLYTKNINKGLIFGSKKINRIIYWSKINVIQFLVNIKHRLQ